MQGWTALGRLMALNLEDDIGNFFVIIMQQTCLMTGSYMNSPFFCPANLSDIKRQFNIAPSKRHVSVYRKQ